jgi:hypothetical protein
LLTGDRIEMNGREKVGVLVLSLDCAATEEEERKKKRRRRINRICVS